MNNFTLTEHQNKSNSTKTSTKRKSTNNWIQRSIELNKQILHEGYTLFPGRRHPFNKIATPFRAKGVALLQITSLVLIQKIISFGQIHHLFGANRPYIHRKQMIRFKKKEDSLRWKSSFTSNACQQNSKNSILMFMKKPFHYHQMNDIMDKKRKENKQDYRIQDI